MVMTMKDECGVLATRIEHSAVFAPNDHERELIAAALNAYALGATGDYPSGKLNDDDEGGINIGVATDGSGNVVLNFGKACAWIALPKPQAMEFAALILKHAMA